MTAPSGNNAAKTRGRPFQPGNPGRPKGARHRTTLAVEALLAGEAEALTRRVIEAALGGDAAALRLCLERISPARKEREVEFTAPKIDGPGDIPAALAAVFDAVAAGEMTPGEGLMVASIIEKVGKAHELGQFTERLSKLEEQVSIKAMGNV
jgi:hypothetical protein